MTDISLEFDTRIEHDITVFATCTCGADLNIVGHYADHGKLGIIVEPCPEADIRSEFFQDLLKHAEQTFGRFAALQLELFAMTWHSTGNSAKRK